MKRSIFFFKFLKTVLVYYVGYLPVGYLYSNTSVTLPLLRDYAEMDEHQGGYIFGLRGIGLVVATLFSGLFFEWYSSTSSGEDEGDFWSRITKISHHKILSSSLIFLSFATASVPLISNFYFLATIHFYMGVFIGFLEIGFILQINYAWGNLADYFLFGLDGVIGFGSLLFPAIMSVVFRYNTTKDFQLRFPYFVCAAVSLLSALGLIFTKSSRKPPEIPSPDDKGSEIELSMLSEQPYSESQYSTETEDSSSFLSESDESSQWTSTNNTSSEYENEKLTNKNESTKANAPSFLQTFLSLENIIHFLDAFIGMIIVGSINSFIGLVFSYLKENKVDTDSNLSIMFSVLCIVYTLSRFSGALFIRFIRVWIVLLVDLFALTIILGLFLLYPTSKIMAWVNSILFAVFAAPVSTSLLIVCQSTYGLSLTPGRTSFLFGAQFLGETTQSYLMAFFSSERFFGSYGVLVIGFLSSVVSFLLYILMLIIGWVYLRRQEDTSSTNRHKKQIN